MNRRAWAVLSLTTMLAVFTAQGIAGPIPKSVRGTVEAVKEAKETDLPLMAKASRIVVEDADGKKVGTIDRGPDVKGILEKLKPGEADPSGGKHALVLSFYQGEQLLRKVQVSRSGEWSIERPGISWVTGSSIELWNALRNFAK